MNICPHCDQIHGWENRFCTVTGKPIAPRFGPSAEFEAPQFSSTSVPVSRENRPEGEPVNPADKSTLRNTGRQVFSAASNPPAPNHRPSFVPHTDPVQFAVSPQKKSSNDEPGEVSAMIEEMTAEEKRFLLRHTNGFRLAIVGAATLLLFAVIGFFVLSGIDQPGDAMSPTAIHKSSLTVRAEPRNDVNGKPDSGIASKPAGTNTEAAAPNPTAKPRQRREASALPNATRLAVGKSKAFGNKKSVFGSKKKKNVKKTEEKAPEKKNESRTRDGFSKYNPFE